MGVVDLQTGSPGAAGTHQPHQNHYDTSPQDKNYLEQEYHYGWLYFSQCLLWSPE